MIYTIRCGGVEADIESFGAELISLRKGGEELIWQGDAWRGHAPVLFPIVGRLPDGAYTYRGKRYEMSIHGFAKNTDFALKEKCENAVTLEITSSEKTLAIYPFDFAFTAHYEISESGKLTSSYTVTNKGTGDMYYMFGCHPGFALRGSSKIGEFTIDFGTQALTKHLLTDGKWVSGALENYPLEGGMYPLNEEEIYGEGTVIFSDTAHRVVLFDNNSSDKIEITYSSNLPYLALWKMPSSDARYICIEPWSGVPTDGGADEDLRDKTVAHLSAGEAETFYYTVNCK